MPLCIRLCLLFFLHSPINIGQDIYTSKLEGKVVKILDGDTFDLLVGKETIRIRLNAIDAPEKKQDFGTKSKQVLAGLCFGKLVLIATHGHDRYNRTIGDVYIGKVYVNARMIELGMAWHFKKYSIDSTLAALENTARQNKSGIWAIPNPVAPWDYRAARKMKNSRLN